MLELIQVANGLKEVKFKMGQEVIKIGDPVTDFHILTFGRCRVIFCWNSTKFLKAVYPLHDKYQFDYTVLKTPEKLSEDKKIKAALQLGALSTKIRLNSRNLTEANANPNKRVFDGPPVHSYEIENKELEKSDDKFHYHVF